jgi:DNA adenine methylase
MRTRIIFLQRDGLDTLQQYSQRADVVFFIDPPYAADGKGSGARLYAYHKLDHAELFRITSGLKGDFLMTYSNDKQIRAVAEQSGFDTAEITMRNTRHRQMKELLIGNDLSWLATTY